MELVIVLQILGVVLTYKLMWDDI